MLLLDKILVTAKSLSFLFNVAKFLGKNYTSFIYKKKDDFLNYQLSFLLNTYIDETTVAQNVPYVEIVNLLDTVEGNASKIEMKVSTKDFKIKGGDAAWDFQKNAGFAALEKSGRIKGNEPAIRLMNVTFGSGNATLEIEKARYFDQAHSNLILDFHLAGSSSKGSLRTLLSEKYKHKLPPLNEPRLANTIGIATLLLYKDNDQWVPYLVKRSSTVAVFPNAIQCSASGVAKWPESAVTFDDFFTDHMYSEIEEEVGLLREEIVDLYPVSLCREFARGGKPQLIYIGRTHLTRKELAQKRKAARRVLKNVGSIQEIVGDTWFKSADVTIIPDKLQTEIFKDNVSHESIISFHYVGAYFKFLQSKSIPF